MFIDGSCILQFYKDTLASPTEKSAKLEAGKSDKEADDAETQVKEGKSAQLFFVVYNLLLQQIC